MKKRIAWLDTAKFLGVLLIVLFHIGANAGYGSAYAIQLCVHLFFLLAGFAERLHDTASLRECLSRGVRRLLIPYAVLAALSLAVYCVACNSYASIPRNALIIACGVPRGYFFAPALWFLSCLFVIRFLFFALRRLCPRPLPMLAVSAALYAAGDFLMNLPDRPLGFFNIDNALYFMLIYAAGYCAFHPVSAVMAADTPRRKLAFFGMGGVSLAYTVIVFFGKQPLAALAGGLYPLRLAADVVHPILLSLFILFLSGLLENVRIFGALGRESLLLCGSEYMAGTLLSCAAGLFGVTLTYPNALSAYVHVLLIVLTAHVLLVPVEKSILKKLGC